jgi:isoamylase
MENQLISGSTLENQHTRPGKPYPLGATPTEEGVNFALFSEHATAVFLCLYNTDRPDTETARILLTERTEFVWHIQVDALQPGQLYGYRVEGPWEPENGHYFNPQKLLLDPYARAISAPVGGDNSQLPYDYTIDDDRRFTTPSIEDSGPTAPKSIIIDATAFDWGDDKAPETPMNRSVMYEMHVKGFTHLHPTIDEPIRGSYAALGTPEAIGYLKKLGVTAVELLPVHQFSNESYWGYNSIGFFAPHNGYSASGMMGGQVTEFKQMVKNLHEAGLEVILDVVYNHTAEGNQMGPMLSFKGIDNRAYYHQVEAKPEYYNDFTGTGNTFNVAHPRALQVVMDSLRYWVTEMHVDGFRFDLASALLRGLAEAGQLSSFLDTVAQDPVLMPVKLIAEPWDIQTYQVGGFPVQWAEWNGKYRDAIRSYWKGDEGKAGEVSVRLLGSPDLYANGRAPWNSVNFITAHDGFTLHDLVSYNEKHNEANGENNNDGTNDNLSWNGGTEGPTDDEAINDLRERQKRNFLATLFLSQGTPMLVMGDEYGRTQQGNNNVYNQDSELSWQRWDWSAREQAQFEFTSQLIALRHDLPLLSRRKFYDADQIAWLRPDGHAMTDDDWQNGNTRCMGLLIDGSKVDEVDAEGNPISDEFLILIVNAYWEDLAFDLPDKRRHWQILLDTAERVADTLTESHEETDRPFAVAARSTVLLKRKVGRK